LASDLTEAEAGMKVMLVDIQEKAQDEPLHELKGGRTGRSRPPDLLLGLSVQPSHRNQWRSVAG
jgi:hypothetical protein